MPTAIQPERTERGGEPPRLHVLLVVIGLFLCSGARLPLGPPSSAVGAVDPMNTLTQLVVVFGSTLACLVHWRRCAALILPAWPFLLLVGLIALSTLWSVFPASTLRRSVSMMTLLLFVVSTYAAFGMTRIMRIALRTMLGLAVLSLVVAVVRPDIGFDVDEYADAIRGVFLQKNVFGFAMMFGALALSYLVLERGKLRLADALTLLFLLAVIVLARATTAFLLTAGIGAVTVLLVCLRRGGGWALAATIGAGAVLVGAMLVRALVDTDALFEAIGKEATFTGRAQIWEEAWRAIAERPLLGYGYAAFWNEASPLVQWIWYAVTWKPPNAHSGYLEVLLQLGWIGMGVTAVMGLETIRRAAMGLSREPRQAACWTLIFLGAMCIVANTESVLLNPDSFLLFWMFAALHLTQPQLVGAAEGAAPAAMAPWRPRGPVGLVRRPAAGGGFVPVFRRRG